MSSEQYPYQTLPSNISTIRVLQLSAGNSSADLRGSLQTVRLADATYSALSYAWGSPTSNFTIYLDGHQLAIRENLYRALCRIRSRFSTTQLWVDALCINQNDDEEKNCQVAMMGQIYERAALVEVWLGESKSARTAYLENFYHRAFQDSSKRTYTNKAVAGTIWQIDRRFKDSSLDKGIDQDFSWQNRVWTLQELLLGSKICLRLGGAHFTYEVTDQRGLGSLLSSQHEIDDEQSQQLGVSTDFLRSLQRRLTTFTHNVEISTDIDRGGFQLELSTSLMSHHDNMMAHQYAFSHGLDLSNIIFELPLLGVRFLLQGALCANPCDIVYSVRSLLRLTKRQRIQVDYKLTYANVCTNATVIALTTEECLDAFNVIQLRDIENQTMPSWTIDFQDLISAGSSLGKLRLSQRDETMRVSQDQSEITLQATVIDEIDATETLQPHEEQDIANTGEHKGSRLRWFSDFPSEYFEYASRVSQGTCQFLTKSGHPGLCTSVVKDGDLIVRYDLTDRWGGPVILNMALRPNGASYHFRGLVAVSEDQESTGKKQDFVIC